jgi:hypothetical protein
MSRNFPPLSPNEQVAVNLITLPFRVASSAVDLIKGGLARAKPVAKPVPQAPAQTVAQPPSTAAPSNTLIIADRVCSAMIGGQSVNFFQYVQAKVIRVSSRVDRRQLEANFTPAIADECGIAFDLDGAIQWIRERGFPRPSSAAKGNRQDREASSNPEPEGSAPPFDAPFKSPRKVRSGLDKTAGAASNGTEAEQSRTLIPAAANKGRPFTGRVTFAGEEKRHGAPGEKPYVTYVMKLESESRAFVKDFVGEHLGELVAEHKVEIGDLVTVQLLGREHFTVEVDGRIENRRRNRYSIKTH